MTCQQDALDALNPSWTSGRAEQRRLGSALRNEWVSWAPHTFLSSPLPSDTSIHGFAVYTSGGILNKSKAHLSTDAFLLQLLGGI